MKNNWIIRTDSIECAPEEIGPYGNSLVKSIHFLFFFRRHTLWTSVLNERCFLAPFALSLITPPLPFFQITPPFPPLYYIVLWTSQGLSLCLKSILACTSSFSRSKVFVFPSLLPPPTPGEITKIPGSSIWHLNTVIKCLYVTYTLMLLSST